MRKIIFQLSLIVCCLTFSQKAVAQEQSLMSFLQSLPHDGIIQQPLDAHFEESYMVKFKQILDHNSPEKGHFTQRIFIGKANIDAPVVFETEGYEARDAKANELSKLLKANQVRVEYRYHGESVPDPRDWEYLTCRQAAEDLHRIRESIGKYFQGAWVSTGISKGGQTTLFYRRFYPDDVVASVPYVAPLPVAVEDPRTDEWFEVVGTKKCRKALAKFQKAVLKRSDEILPSIDWYLKRSGNHVSGDKREVLEYMVLEYPFSFWQWNCNCDGIPKGNEEAKVLSRHLIKIVSPYYYTDEGISAFEPSFYEFIRILGYYGFPHDHLEKWLQVATDPNNVKFAPADVDLTYDDKFVPDVLDWLSKEGNNIIYIYGALDPWTACGVTPSAATNSLRVDVKDFHHASRIRHLSPEQRAEVIAKLEAWIGVEID